MPLYWSRCPLRAVAWGLATPALAAPQPVQRVGGQRTLSLTHLRRRLLPAAALALLLPSAAWCANARALDDRDDFVTVQLKRFHTPRVAIAVAKDGELLLAMGHGLRDADQELQGVVGTRFAVSEPGGRQLLFRGPPDQPARELAMLSPQGNVMAKRLE